MDEMSMDEQKLRAWLAKQLKQPEDVLERLWTYLIDHHYVSDAIEVGASGKAELLAAAREQIALARDLQTARVARRSTGSAAVPPQDLGAYARARSHVATEAMALAAAREPQVKKFRRRYLGGTPCSLAEARQLLTSTAAGTLSAGYFEKRGIPLLGHTATVLDRQQHINKGTAQLALNLRIDWDGGTDLQPFSWEERFGFDRRDRVLSWMDEDEELHEVDVWPGTVLDWLRQVSERLARWYAWEPAQAVWFVLTDEPPVRSPLEASITIRSYPALNGSRVTLSVEPWMPADIVEQSFRAIQRDLLGKENRPLSARNLALFRFDLAQDREVERMPEGQRVRLTWKERMARWNQEHPTECYTEERLFARDVNRARRAVLLHNYRLRLGDADEAEGTES
jgi:hypothetical protein